MKIKAFTFVEILISITIIWIITSYGLYSFMNFYDNKRLNGKISYLSDIINENNKLVKNKEIYDYSINIKQYSKNIVIYKNIFDEKNYQTIDIIWNSWTINFIKEEVSDSIFLKKYKNWKLSYLTWTNQENIDTDLIWNNNYKFTSYLSWSNISFLNDIDIVHLDKNEEIKDSGVFIEKIEDAESNIINDLYIKNINNNISFFDSTTELNTYQVRIYINNWRNSNYLTIKK